MDKYTVLKHHFGYASFRGGQERLIDAVLDGRDVLGIMPTGGGKSLCYQIPALLLPGMTVVVSPLISLMKDQVMALKNAGVAAAYVNSSLTGEQLARVYDNIRRGVYKLLYIAPERLQSDGFAELARRLPIALLAVDEAHCISQWGNDFRPSYLRIADFIRGLPTRPVVAAFTATATEQVRRDIEEKLEMRAPLRVVTGFDRPNLRFEVLRPRQRPAALLELVEKRRGKSGIIYCLTRSNVEKVCALLRAHGVPATRYHAGLSDAERQRNQEDFVYDRCPVIAATNAFGMGIDKSNVSYVIHYNMPMSLEAYYQEAGRAGRDGEDAVCCLLYQTGDVRLNTFLIDHAQDMSQMDEQTRQVVTARAKERLRQMTFYATGGGCLRAKILQYFGEKVERPFCGNCSGCMAREEERDVSRQAGQIVAAVIAMNGRYGKATVARVLCGQADARLRERGLDKLSAFGSMKAEGEANVRAMIDELIAGDVLTVTEGDYPLLREGAYARDVLRGDMPIRMALLPTDAAPEIKRRVKQKEFVNKALYSRLSDLRKQIAMDQNVPPFIIFTNATLKDMAAKAPRTRAQMLRVAGVGEGKMQRYGDAFLREIAAYEEDEA